MAHASKTSKTKSKKNQVLTLLKRSQGASINEIQKVTDWQLHSIRSFFSRIVRKQLGLTIITSMTKSKVQRYRIAKEEG